MGFVDQAGAIVVSIGKDGIPLTLLVTAKRNADHWVFPKGHVEPGETLEVAAVREAEEEAGVTGVIIGVAGSTEFALGSHTYRVHYFVLMTRDTGRPERGRQMKWCAYDEAIELLPFENTRALLTRTWPDVVARVRKISRS
jgi:8-oxo-dGTP pyrophosphatase MutT (NUDIX family)